MLSSIINKDNQRGGEHTVKLYVDIYFLFNFWLDFSVLFLTAQFEKEEGKYRRKGFSLKKGCLAAIVGALFGLFPPVFGWNLLVRILSYIVGMISMLFLAFGTNQMFQRIPVFLGNSALLGGILLSFPFRKHAIVIAGMTWMAVLCIKHFLGRLFYIQHINQHLCEVLLEFEGIEKEAIGLWDTGNRLKDPYSKKPVIVVAEQLLKEYLDVAKKIAPQHYVLIPYTSVGGTGMLEGVRLTKAVVRTTEQKLIHTDVVAACGRKDLFLQKPYQIILHTELIPNVTWKK